MQTRALWSQKNGQQGAGCYLFVIPDAVLAAEAFLLAVDQQEVVGRRPAGQIVATLLAAVHDQPVGFAVHIETRVAADLVGHVLKANLMPNLEDRENKTLTKQQKIKTDFLRS